LIHVSQSGRGPDANAFNEQVGDLADLFCGQPHPFEGLRFGKRRAASRATPPFNRPVFVFEKSEPLYFI
jgi:hypothetical protein